MAIAVYPGTFDPITSGHEDLVRRASGLFDELVLAVSDSRGKGTLFTFEERLQIARDVMQPFANVRVEGFSGLLAEFVTRVGGRVVVRGLRSVADFEYEFRMAGMNHYLMPEVETLFMAPTDGFQFVTGTLVREIAMLGGDVSRFVPAVVNDRLIAKRNSL
ncbi:MAG: pantetheine-phosphate adenylyltransferase [Burkholderiaceae bacterium]|nr:pantetheine-phosphate adenylyltransferase [Burkholderiaceae bacterium]